MEGSGQKTISGFSRLSKRGKIKWIVENFFRDPEAVMHELVSYWHGNDDHQKVLDGISENTISNYHLPYGVAPNFVINGKTYCVPMVIEESSVVAAASSAAKFWMNKGGFQAEILGTEKLGQIHFSSNLSFLDLKKVFEKSKDACINACRDLTSNMEERGGGIRGIELKSVDALSGSDQLILRFETCESMGANFINSVLERYAYHFEKHVRKAYPECRYETIMCILSNYTPDCLVNVKLSSPINKMDPGTGMTAEQFCLKFRKAVEIAQGDIYRAVTHNKGIFNGIDAVILATGNDFRAIEACGHAYASKDGTYRSLSKCTIENGQFEFSMTIPLALGTIGGATAVHPIAKRSLELLEHPDAKELMRIVASVGLAQNFAAIRSLVTTGIQDGHMRMHLSNILNQLKASPEEEQWVREKFQQESVSFSAVQNYLSLRRRAGR